MPRPPLFRSPSDVPDTAELPAVCAVAGAGRLTCCVGVARFGRTARASEAWILTSYDQRTALDRALPNGTIDYKGPSYIGHDSTRPATLHPSGNPGRYFNAEPLWVNAAWIVSLEPALIDGGTLGSDMLIRAARAAIELCK